MFLRYKWLILYIMINIKFLKDEIFFISYTISGMHAEMLLTCHCVGFHEKHRVNNVKYRALTCPVMPVISATF